MNQTTVVVQGFVTADGTLKLAEKLHVPAGRVQVLIQPLPDVSSDTLSQRMEAVWAGQKARGHVPRTREQIDADLRDLREYGVAEIEAAEQFHEESQRAQTHNGTDAEKAT